MSGEDYCEHDMLVAVSWNGKVLAIPFALLKPLDADEDSVDAIDDWHYWIRQGYSFWHIIMAVCFYYQYCKIMLTEWEGSEDSGLQ